MYAEIRALSDCSRPSRADAAVLSGGDYRSPQIGDTGTVVEVFSDPHEAYCVEAVAPDGRIEWLVDFCRMS